MHNCSLCMFICSKDITQTGHLLGPAQHLSKQATPERHLSPVACTITRLIMHAAFLWSSVCVQVRVIIITIVAYNHIL